MRAKITIFCIVETLFALFCCVQISDSLIVSNVVITTLYIHILHNDYHIESVIGDNCTLSDDQSLSIDCR